MLPDDRQEERRSERRPEEGTEKRKGWTYVEKLSTAALVAFLSTLLTIVFSFWDTLRDHDSFIAELNEKRPSGLTLSQQMLVNTNTNSALLKELMEIHKNNRELSVVVDKNHDTFHRYASIFSSEITQVKETCAQLKGRLSK